MTSKKIFLIWNITILLLCIILAFVLRERIAAYFGQPTAVIEGTVEVESEKPKNPLNENTGNTVEKNTVEINAAKKNTEKPKRRPRPPKEVNFNDSNASSFAIEGLDDVETVPDEIRFAGTAGTGKKIVFVIDSTEIMGSDSGTRALTPWSFACEELAFSFKDLNDTQSFQVFFFAEEPDYLSSAKGEPQWLLSTPQNKKESFDFLKKHIPSGKGSAFSALKEALALKPDAVFFLATQKSVPLTEAETEALQTLQETLPLTVPIHTVEIGKGTESSEKSAFQKLADMTKGQYRWISGSIRGLRW